ncbi:MAG: efflux RND transporter periplasmic adaptor subunit [bacterium]|nr:efflux RND transporter periplasmic adaptor subunit [bacterium]
MSAAKKKTFKRRLLVWGGTAAIVILIGLSLAPKPQPADFATVDRGALSVTIDEEGETRVRDRYLVSAPLAGRVLRIELEPGDQVSAGETVLATFQPTDPVLLDARSRAEAEARVKAAEAALGRARADRDRSQAELKKAEADLERTGKLASEEIVSQDRLEVAELERDTRQKAVKAAEYAVRTTAYDLEVARASLVEPGSGNGDREPIAIRSPVNGTVLRRLRESEAIVPAGEPLLEVADPADLEIVSDLLSTDAVQVRRGQKVLVEQWGGDRPLHGVVRRVEPYGFTKVSALGVEEQRVNVVIDFEDPKEAWEALGDGYRVEVRIVTWEEEDVVRVPTSSLFRNGEGWAVFAVDAGKASLREIEIGMRNGLEAQVISGLGEGEQVIVHPSDSIVDGVKVEERGV